MDRGTYAAASAGFLQFRKLEVQNNNLANLDTVGFKRQFLTNEVQPFDQTLANALGGADPYAKPDHDRTPGAINVKTVTDFASGPIKTTGNPFDVALADPRDFFVINTPNGIEYTRAGDFRLDGEGNIVTPDGSAVQGDGGPIAINGPGGSITPNGTVLQGTTPIGRLQVVRVDDPTTLDRAGNNRFKVQAGKPAPAAVDAQIITSSLEMSNATPVSSMVDLIVTNRAFEAYTKAAQTIDQLNQTAIGQVGRRQ